MIRETPLSLDGCILHRPLQDVNRQIAKKAKFHSGEILSPPRIDKRPGWEYPVGKSKGALLVSCGFREAPLLFFRFISKEWS
jgi:hypothetical protein